MMTNQKLVNSMALAFIGAENKRLREENENLVIEFKLSIPSAKITDVAEYPNDTSKKEIAKDLREWVLDRIGSFAQAKILDK